jgi:hypothetical protein
MAVGIAEFELKKYRFPNAAFRHFLIKLYHIRLLFRRAILFLEPKPKHKSRVINITMTQGLEKGAKEFSKQGWVFIENIFPDEVHKLLVQDWPSFYHFIPAYNIHKSYDMGFISQDQTSIKYPIFEELQQYLCSDEFSQRINNFSPSKAEVRNIRKILLSRAGYKSACINHLDSVSTQKNNENESINFIFFIKGTGGPRSGGTCIYHDENGDILFEPTNTTNSCLIYRSDKHYHGFPPMSFGKYRWMIGGHAQARAKK